MIYYKPEEIFTIFDSENFDRYLIYYVSYNIPYKSRDTYHHVEKSPLMKHIERNFLNHFAFTTRYREELKIHNLPKRN